MSYSTRQRQQQQMLFQLVQPYQMSYQVSYPGTWIPGSRVAYPGLDPGPVKPAICPVTNIVFIKALTSRVATYRLNCCLYLFYVYICIKYVIYSNNKSV